MWSPLRASSDHRLIVAALRARRMVGSSSLYLSFREVAKAALDCAHRTSTVSSCAFCEQGGRLAAPSSSFCGRALREHRRSTDSIPHTFVGQTSLMFALYDA